MDELDELPLALLRWLSFRVDKTESAVDKSGVQTFGPFQFYTAMSELYGKDLVHVMVRGSEPHYVIPREVDYRLTMEEKRENSDASVYFNMEQFQLYLFLYWNSLIQGNEEEFLLKDFPQLHEWFLDQAETLYKIMDGKTLADWLFHGEDDFMERYALHFFTYISGQKQSGLVMKNWKEALYGQAIRKDELTTSKDLLKEWMYSPLFKETAGLSLLDLEGKDHSVAEAVPLHNNEWLFPVKTNPMYLFAATTFGKVISSGQMIHLKYSKETVAKGKKVAEASLFWEEFQQQLMHYHGVDMQELWAGGDIILKKQEVFVFYQISDQQLLEHLVKVGNAKLSIPVVQSENGIFINESFVSKWEKFLKETDLSVREEEVFILKNERRAPIGIQRTFLPKEWEELNKLPSVNFQLMSYKENMAARIVRQSQAFQLPLVMEDKEGNIFAAEVRTLQFNAGQGEMETYQGNRIKLKELKRLAVYHPTSDKYRISSFI